MQSGQGDAFTALNLSITPKLATSYFHIHGSFYLYQGHGAYGVGVGVTPHGAASTQIPVRASVNTPGAGYYVTLPINGIFVPPVPSSTTQLDFVVKFGMIATGGLAITAGGANINSTLIIDEIMVD